MNIRDFLEGPPHPSESVTLRTLVANNPPVVDPNEGEVPGLIALLPGDEEVHPLAGVGGNPLPGLSPQDLQRLLNANLLPPEHIKAVREYLRVFQKLEGQTLYDPRNDPRNVESFKWVNPKYTYSLSRAAR